MPHNTREKRIAYYHKSGRGNQTKRRKYFREYNRKNKARLKMISMMGGIAKMMVANKLMSEDLVSGTQQMRKEHLKLELKINQIKNFINIK